MSCHSKPDRLSHAVKAALGGIEHEGRRCRLVPLLELARQIRQRLRQQRFAGPKHNNEEKRPAGRRNTGSAEGSLSYRTKEHAH